MNKNIAARETLCIFNDSKYIEQFSSFSPDDMAGKVKLYNAINSPDQRLKDIVNMPINIKDVIVRKVSLSEKVERANTDENDDAGDFRGSREGFRVIILDTEGKSYTATSTGIYNSICTLRNVFGTLHFEEGLKVAVKNIKTKNGDTLTLSILE